VHQGPAAWCDMSITRTPASAPLAGVVIPSALPTGRWKGQLQAIVDARCTGRGGTEQARRADDTLLRLDVVRKEKGRWPPATAPL